MACVMTIRDVAPLCPTKANLEPGEIKSRTVVKRFPRQAGSFGGRSVSQCWPIATMQEVPFA